MENDKQSSKKKKNSGNNQNVRFSEAVSFKSRDSTGSKQT